MCTVSLFRVVAPCEWMMIFYVWTDTSSLFFANIFTCNYLKTEFSLIIYKSPVRTSQETHYLSVTKPNGLMLFRETFAVFCESHAEHNTLCGHNAEFYYVKADGTYINHLVLKG
jgi:hypothetical protein